MSGKFILLTGAAAAALVFASCPAFAQTTEDTSAAQTAQASPLSEQDIIVTGIRATLRNSADAKRNSNQIQDSLLAEDLGNLPDTNIAETLQRIPGVQISRNTRGEGNAYVVHGLRQVNTTVNGRQLFTVTNRSATLLDFSSDILSGVDVYKTATSDQIEGGLGGLINIRTARPLDYDGFHLGFTASGNYSEFKSKASPRVSGVVSSRWDTGAGEFGLLFGGQFERIYSAGYQTSTNAYANNTGLFDVNGNGVRGEVADTVTIPGQVRARYETGNRVRSALYGAAQWRPTPDLTLSADALYTHSGGHSFTQQLTVQTDTQSTGLGTPTFKQGTTIPASYTLGNAVVRSAASFSDNPYDTYNIALNLEWNSGPLTITGQAAYVQSEGPFYSRSITLGTRAPSVAVDLSGKTPDFSVSGVDLTNPANYTATPAYFDLGTNGSGREPSARLDARYEFDDGGFLTALLAGARWARHRAINDVYTLSSNRALTQPLAQVTELTSDDLFNDHEVSTNQWLAIDSRFMNDMRRTRYLAGVPLTDPPFPLTSNYDYTEETLAGYVQAQFAFDLGIPFDGNAGLRAVRTDGVQKVYQANASGELVQISGGEPYENYLPSVNLRAKFTPNLFLRLAYSKAITRPEYGQLSPALILNPTTLTGSGGNPGLVATEADQFDASLEYYFGDANYAAVSLFQKNVTGFIQEFRAEETIGGQTYLITRPRNANDGTVKGFEVAYQQFLDFLPGLLGGLGLQANYTYVDSAIEVQGRPDRVPADQLSKHSYNLTGIYERGPLSLHASYNWRSRSVQSNSADALGRRLWNAPQSSLDFSATYELTDNISIKFDVVNIEAAYQRQYYNTWDLPGLANQLDRSYQLGFHIDL